MACNEGIIDIRYAMRINVLIVNGSKCKERERESRWRKRNRKYILIFIVIHQAENNSKAHLLFELGSNLCAGNSSFLPLRDRAEQERKTVYICVCCEVV